MRAFARLEQPALAETMQLIEEQQNAMAVCVPAQHGRARDIREQQRTAGVHALHGEPPLCHIVLVCEADDAARIVTVSTFP